MIKILFLFKNQFTLLFNWRWIKRTWIFPDENLFSSLILVIYTIFFFKNLRYIFLMSFNLNKRSYFCSFIIVNDFLGYKLKFLNIYIGPNLWNRSLYRPYSYSMLFSIIQLINLYSNWFLFINNQFIIFI